MIERNDAAPQATFEAGWLRALARRYEGYAAEAAEGGATEAAALLDDLARELEEEVAALGGAPVEAGLPDADQPERPPHRMQTHDVWRLAVADRERLFEALSARAGQATGAARRQAWEERARAQLDHVARWRLERRRAGRQRHATKLPSIDDLSNLEAFHAGAEERIEGALGALADRSEPLSSVDALIEDHFDTLLEIAEQTSDAAIQARAQSLAEAQLVLLRQIRGLRLARDQE